MRLIKYYYATRARNVIHYIILNKRVRPYNIIILNNKYSKRVKDFCQLLYTPEDGNNI